MAKYVDMEIRTYDPKLSEDLFNHPGYLIKDEQRIISEDARLRFRSYTICLSQASPTILNLVVELISSPEKVIAYAVIANWIYNKVKNRVNSVTINRCSVKVDPEEIAKALEKLASETQQDGDNDST